MPQKQPKLVMPQTWPDRREIFLAAYDQLEQSDKAVIDKLIQILTNSDIKNMGVLAATDFLVALGILMTTQTEAQFAAFIKDSDNSWRL